MCILPKHRQYHLTDVQSAATWLINPCRQGLLYFFQCISSTWCVSHIIILSITPIICRHRHKDVIRVRSRSWSCTMMLFRYHESNSHTFHSPSFDDDIYSFHWIVLGYNANIFKASPTHVMSPTICDTVQCHAGMQALLLSPSSGWCKEMPEVNQLSSYSCFWFLRKIIAMAFLFSFSFFPPLQLMSID